MKKLALFLGNLLAVVALAVLTIKLLPIPWLTQKQTSWLIDASKFFHFEDVEWFGTVAFGVFYLLVGGLEWLLIRSVYRRLRR